MENKKKKRKAPVDVELKVTYRIPGTISKAKVQGVVKKENKEVRKG
jgi:hypothetical protein